MQHVELRVRQRVHDRADRCERLVVSCGVNHQTAVREAGSIVHPKVRRRRVHLAIVVEGNCLGERLECAQRAIHSLCRRANRAGGRICLQRVTLIGRELRVRLVHVIHGNLQLRQRHGLVPRWRWACRRIHLTRDVRKDQWGVPFKCSRQEWRCLAVGDLECKLAPHELAALAVTIVGRHLGPEHWLRHCDRWRGRVRERGEGGEHDHGGDKYRCGYLYRQRRQQSKRRQQARGGHPSIQPGLQAGTPSLV